MQQAADAHVNTIWMACQAHVQRRGAATSTGKDAAARMYVNTHSCSASCGAPKCFRTHAHKPAAQTRWCDWINRRRCHNPRLPCLHPLRLSAAAKYCSWALHAMHRTQLHGRASHAAAAAAARAPHAPLTAPPPQGARLHAAAAVAAAAAAAVGGRARRTASMPCAQGAHHGLAGTRARATRTQTQHTPTRQCDAPSSLAC